MRQNTMSLNPSRLDDAWKFSTSIAHVPAWMAWMNGADVVGDALHKRIVTQQCTHWP